jgi:MSHA pilin protein MshC
MGLTSPDRRGSIGFTLVELVSIIVILGVMSIALVSRMGSSSTAPIQSSRDDLIAALFFAQQQAMMRSNIKLVLTTNTISVEENNIPIKVTSDYYPLVVAKGVTLTPVTLIYDKLGRTTPTNITLTGSGNSSGVSARVRVEASGYAFAN